MVANVQTNEPELNIVQHVGLPMKMVKIMAAVGNIQKGGTNSQQNYKFIQSDDVVEAIRHEMVANNVALFSRAVSYEMTSGTTSKGTQNFHAVVQFEFTLVDADSGESTSCTWYGESIDTSDKSFNKAGTSALKYWLLKTFMIAAGEPDGDKESPEFERQRSAKSSIRGNGSQSRQNASNSSAASNGATGHQNGSNDAKNADIHEWTATSVIVRKDKNDNPYLQYICNEGKPTGRGRDLLRKAGYDCEDWTAPGITYDLIPPALVTVQKNGNFWNVLEVKPVQTEVTF